MNDMERQQENVSNKGSDLRLRLQEATERWHGTLTLSLSQQQDILVARAARLAQGQQTADKGTCLDLVEFRLADEHYGIECLYIQEVYPLKSLTPVPGVPAFVAGIVNIRGEIVSVIDLKQFFELPNRGLTDLTRVIILKQPQTTKPMTFGILAEEVLGTVSLPLKELQPLLPTLTGIRAEYLSGVGFNRLIVLDAKKLLTDKKMVVYQDMES